LWSSEWRHQGSSLSGVFIAMVVVVVVHWHPS
jgi:hypothetical protein